MKKYCLALDLKDDPKSIDAYIQWHKNVWPEIEESIKISGILTMEIYRVENRLFMIIHTEDNFSFENKKNLDRKNPTVEKWEKLMDEFQQKIPGTTSGEKWRIMEKIYHLD
ncbi:MAG: L-rhamnose mutarotase [Cyclobacteriaceae bacterium]|nr:L-rhamnose mutarotase [Cyclobacteriaceae bacterium]